MKKLFQFIFKLLLFIVLIIITTFTYLTLTDYKPKSIENVYTSNEKQVVTKIKFEILTWNIGYAGLGSDMDFFYDGGEKVRTTKKRTQQNIDAISQKLSEYSNVDFILLQEVDIKAKRSYYINNIDNIKNKLPEFKYFYAPNYKVKYVPIPITEPMGEVESGLVSFSKYEPYSVVRHSFDGNFSWPKKLFMLDRCFMVSRFKLKNNKDLLIINTHNSAFDDGTLKAKQLKQISDFVTAEYDKGNYIVLGGDWNQNPPNFNDNIEENNEDAKATFKISSISKEFLPNWHMFYDVNIPSNRFLTQAYVKGKTKETILDMFLCSPNIDKVDIKTLDLEFKNSDHNPVLLKFELL